STIIDELTSMNGVGPKTAACVLLFSLGRDIFPVDTHVHRICVRLGLAPESRTPDETFRRMIGLVPRGKGYAFHTNLIRFGRTVCRSNVPLCGECNLYRYCRYDRKDRSRKRAAPTEAEHHFMLLDNVKVTGDN
ncbi:MAG: endonuclease III, partial [Ignavibacteria bacterium]|nr:endonuclease III [Ignavibacteria bacterium]